jgi:transcriptional regulator with XRE-family HTH domain
MPDDSPLLIQKLRLQRGWSQEQLAELTGLSVRTIQRIERGQTPSAESLKAIAAVLEVQFGALREAHMSSLVTPPMDQAISFYMQVIEYVLIIGFLAIVNLLTQPRYLWMVWRALREALCRKIPGTKIVAGALSTAAQIQITRLPHWMRLILLRRRLMWRTRCNAAIEQSEWSTL